MKRCIICRKEADSEPGHGYYNATAVDKKSGKFCYVYACDGCFLKHQLLWNASVKYPEMVI